MTDSSGDTPSGDTPIFDETARALGSDRWPATDWDADFLPDIAGTERDYRGEEWPTLDG